MLSNDELKDALHGALKSDEKRCTRYCTVGAEIDEGRYRCFHNGLGPSQTDEQIVYAPAVLGLSKDPMSAKFKAWLDGLHAVPSKKLDLNATMEIEAPWVDPAVWQQWQSAPALTSWPWRRIFDAGTGIANWLPDPPTQEA